MSIQHSGLCTAFMMETGPVFPDIHNMGNEEGMGQESVQNMEKTSTVCLCS